MVFFDHPLDPDIPRDTSREYNAFVGALESTWHELVAERGLPEGTPPGRHVVEVAVLFDQPPRAAVLPCPALPVLAEWATDALYALGIEPEDEPPEERGRRTQRVALELRR